MGAPGGVYLHGERGHLASSERRLGGVEPDLPSDPSALIANTYIVLRSENMGLIAVRECECTGAVVRAAAAPGRYLYGRM